MNYHNRIIRTPLGKKTRRHPAEGKLRLSLVQFVLAVTVLIVLARLVQIQVFQHSHFEKLADTQYNRLLHKKAKRGLILDRDKTRLASNRTRYDLGIDTRQIEDIRKTSLRLGKILERDATALRRELSQASGFITLKRGIEVERATLVQMFNIEGAKIEENSDRNYPLNDKAAQVVGFLDIDGAGIHGIEKHFNDILTGEDGKKILQKDALGRELMPVGQQELQIRNGDDIILTLDHVIQTIAEDELNATVSKYNATGGTVVITDPVTGEILAMASSPGFDANQANVQAPERWRIRAITDIFEPGSTFKIVTMVVALSERIKDQNDIIFCENGKWQIFGERISDSKKYGWLSVKNVLKQSSNIGMAKIALEIGKERVFKAARDFGFGNSTGIELPGEVSGILRRPTEWSKFSLAAISYGHEIAVTALQMAMAYGAIANGGLLMKPAIIKEIIPKKSDRGFQFKPQVIRRVLAPDIAQQLGAILEEVVRDGTGQLANMEGHRIAGKTGTAQKPLTGKPGYSHSKYVASFAGFYPSDDPRYLIYIAIDEPGPIHSGGQVAAPTFRRILHRIMEAKGIPIQQPDTEKQPRVAIAKAEAPNLVGHSIANAERILNQLNIDYDIGGEGLIVQEQHIEKDENGKNFRLVLVPRAPASGDYRIMPDITGLPLRRAVSELSQLGLNAKIIGSGQVVKQAPEAGARIRAGAQCMIESRPFRNISQYVRTE